MQVNTLILGAGAAGLFCAAHAGPEVLVVDHAAAAGEKIRISGGGRCNFTNLHSGPGNFLSRNPHFAKSALARFGPRDFLALVDRHGIAWHEKTLGQLFCDGSARQIVAMLTGMAAAGGARLWLRTEVGTITRGAGGFTVALRREGQAVTVTARNLVVAAGGKSIPKMGATGLAYDIAARLGVAVTETRPGLVPLTFAGEPFAPLAGVALPVTARAGSGRFDEALLFTHRGLSGPAILQISSCWREGQPLEIDLLPGIDLAAHLRAARQAEGRRALSTVIARLLPARLADHLAPELGLAAVLGTQSDAQLARLEAALHRWTLRPTGTEGYRTAEVTLGGIDTDALDARTMQAKAVPGLYFIGECVDVTGWLGGYNFQWAWASGHACATAIAGSP